MKPFLSKRSIRRTAVLLSVVLLTVSLFAGIQAYRFHHFTDTLFCQEMESDTLSMHYILAYPENYGIAPDSAVLSVYSKEGQDAGFDALRRYKKSADAINPLFFSRDSRLLLALLRQQLDSRLQEAKWPYYAEPLSPGSGIQSTLPILLAEYTFRTRQDVDNYLSLLSQIPAYLEGFAVYEKEKADAGLFMSDTTADKVIEQCYQIMDARQLADGSHFLITTFAERLQDLIACQVVTSEEADMYLQKNRELLLNHVLPAYESLGDALLLLKGTGSNAGGLAAFPDGKEYYAFLFAQTTGCSRPIPEVEQLLAAQLQKDGAALSALLAGTPALPAIAPEEEFPQAGATDYMEDVQKRMATDFPALPGAARPACTIKPVSPSLEPYCSPAFYLTPPVDDISENSIYINGKDNPDGLELYTTLAHEGWPGHLYQTVYYQLHQQQNHINPARNLLHYGGYTEGWALYVEMLSYEYGEAYMKEQGMDEDAILLARAMRLNRSIQLGLYTFLDLQIHYNNAGYDKVHDLLSRFGISDPAVTKDIYEYIVEEPANYPKYYVGYLEFLLLKQAAMETWQNEYSDLRFHQMILETGPCPFSVFWNRLATG